MRKIIIVLFINLFFIIGNAQIAEVSTYLKSVVKELNLKWPENKTINIVFHGHSVTTGYFVTPNIKTLEAYPHLTLINLKKKYNTAAINCITTSIGGEQSEQGAQRFISEVLCMRPDVLFIDYALNDRSIGLERAQKAWSKMIELALKYGCKIILLTPTPDNAEEILNNESPLAKHAQQIRSLASKYHVGLVDSYNLFKTMKQEGIVLNDFMAQSNHINEKGHKIVASVIDKWF